MRTAYLTVMSVLLVLSNPLVGCFCAAQETGGAEARIVRLKGANVMVNICDKIGQEFSKTRDIRVIASGGGTGVGFESLCEKKCDIVLASRKIIPKEVQLTTLCGVKPVERQIGWIAVAIVVNPANTLSQLTVDQLGKLLSGELTNWSQVGGANKPVLVVSSQGHTGTAMFIRHRVLNDGYFSSEAVSKKRYYEILKEVERKPEAIGYASLADARFGAGKGMNKIVSIKENEESPAVYPSDETLRSGAYPLRQPLYFYWDPQTAKRDVKEFVDFFLSRSGKSM